MGKKGSISTTPGNLITNWAIGAKRKVEGNRIKSPTNETGSPDKKNQKATSPMNVERESHDLDPIESSPQRDKTENHGNKMDTEETERHTIPPTTEAGEMNPTNPDKIPKTSKDNIDSSMETEDNTEIVPDTKTNKEEASTKKNAKVEAERKGSEKQIPDSVLKRSFLNTAKAAKHLPAPLLPQWKAYRLACMFEIDRPENKSDRTQILATELNKMLTSARDYTSKVFVRKFEEHFTPRESEKKHWITKFDKKKASDLNDFTFGFYGFQAPRGGMHRLSVQIIVPIATDILGGS